MLPAKEAERSQMKCREFEDRISAYLEEDLGANSRATMDLHASTCRGCSESLSQTKALTGRLGQLARQRPSAGFDFALRSRLLMETSREGRWLDWLANAARPAFPRFALAGATAVLVLFGAASVLMEDEPSIGPAPMAAADRGALKLRALSAESYPISERYYRERGDSLRAAAKRLPSRRKVNAGVRPVAVRF